MTKPTLDLRETPEDLAILQDELRGTRTAGCSTQADRTRSPVNETLRRSS